MTEERTEQTMTAGCFQHQVDRVVERIEHVARQVRLEARVGEQGSFTIATANMVHALQWGIANVPMESLVRAAADADVARMSVLAARGEQPE